MYFLGFPRVVKVNLLAMLAICLQNIIERTIIFCQKDTLNFFLYHQQSLNNTYSTAPYRRDPLKSGTQIGLGSPLTPLVYLVLLNFCCAASTMVNEVLLLFSCFLINRSCSVFGPFVTISDLSRHVRRVDSFSVDISLLKRIKLGKIKLKYSPFSTP